jgi:hypothetical protein
MYHPTKCPSSSSITIFQPRITLTSSKQTGQEAHPRYSANVSLLFPTYFCSQHPLTNQNPYAYAEQYMGDSPIGHGKFDNGFYTPAQDYQPNAHDYLVSPIPLFA